MSMAEYDDKDALAAAYALGELDEAQRAEIDRQYANDSDWQELLVWWQARLYPLSNLIEPVEPPSQVWGAIEARLNQEASPSAMAGQSGRPTPSEPLSATVNESLELWRQRARYWQMATLASIVAMACIVGVMVLKPFPQQRTPTSAPGTVAVLQDEQNAPLWAVSYLKQQGSGAELSSEFGELLVTVLADPDRQSNQSHQMWMVLGDGSGVQSVGLLPGTIGEIMRLELPRPLTDAAELAVSLEPLGGVPGPEHGPVVTRSFVISTDGI